MELEHLIFSQGPQRVAPFSHAVRAGEYLFITGQMPTLKNDKKLLDNIKYIMLNSLQPVEMVSQGFSFFLEVSGESNF